MRMFAGTNPAARLPYADLLRLTGDEEESRKVLEEASAFFKQQAAKSRTESPAFRMLYAQAELALKRYANVLETVKELKAENDVPMVRGLHSEVFHAQMTDAMWNKRLGPRLVIYEH